MFKKVLVLVSFSLSIAHTFTIVVPQDYITIQAGINASVSGDTVLVSSGIYAESINFTGKNLVVMSEHGMDSTIIRGDSTQRVVTFESGEGPEAMLVGFTIENGNGGILCTDYSDPTIYLCKIRNNHATTSPYSDFLLQGGSGMFIYNSSPLLMNTIIIQNGNPEIFGGGVLLRNSSSKIVNCVIAGNRGLYYNGIFFLNSANSIVLNTIIWDNDFGPIMGNPINVLFSDIQGGWPGEGNIDQEPQFVDAENGDYHLVLSSPCIDAGQSSFFSNDGDGTANDMGSFGGSGFFMGMGNIDVGNIPVRSYLTYPLRIYNLLAKPITMVNILLMNEDLCSASINFPLNLFSTTIIEIPVTITPQMIGIDSCQIVFSVTDGINTETIGTVIKAEGVASQGDLFFRRIGTLDAGMVATRFKNYGEIMDYPNQPRCEWPKGSGHDYLDGIAFIIQAETEDNSGNIIHPMETQYREFVDSSPWGDPWGWEPLPGYFNPVSNTIAMSTTLESWPTHWPNRSSDWDGYWNGFSGKGVMQADQETYFVFDDYQDQEWDFTPLDADPTRGGLGLQVEARGYAWDNPQFEDLLIWHYSIHNLSDHDYQQVVLGLYLDVGVGGVVDGSDDLGVSLPDENMVYFYDTDGLGGGGWSPVGHLGIRCLEMPGNHIDGIDNDSDGLIDESRDNNIDDDGDWDPQTDDVGSDGVLETYDSGEGDGIPTDGEPNFDKTDSDESDDLDINTVRFFQIHDYELRDDEENWQVFTSGEIDSTSVAGQNVGSFIISESFPLLSGETTYFSYAIILGEDLEDMLSNAGSISPLGVDDEWYLQQPEAANLHQNYPNPFNPITTIQYSLVEAGMVTLRIFDIRGRVISSLQDGVKPPGSYQVQWNGMDETGHPMSTGVYFCRLQTGNFSETIKMVYLR